MVCWHRDVADERNEAEWYRFHPAMLRPQIPPVKRSFLPASDIPTRLGFGQAGGFAVEDAACGFRGYAARAEAGSADGEDQGWGFAGEVFEGGYDGVFVVGEDEGAKLGVGPLLEEDGDRGGAGGVFHLALRAAVGDG